MFKFINTESGTPTRKRQQSERACEKCRKRKKRCCHTVGHEDAQSTLVTTHPNSLNNSSLPAQNLPLSTVTSETAQHTSTNALTNVTRRDVSNGDTSLCPPETLIPTPTSPRLSNSNTEDRARHTTRTEDNEIRGVSVECAQRPETLTSRFIGDLNPEGIFLAATNPDATRGDSVNNSVGVWLTTNPTRHASPSENTNTQANSASTLFYDSAPMVTKVFIPVLKQESLSTIPPADRFEALSKIYFDRIHPIFPVIDRDSYYARDLDDPARILLQQGICLAASKDFAAKKDLFLTGAGPTLNCREFGNRLLGAMRISIEFEFVTNRLVLIQVLALMSQFIDGSDGGDMSSQLCGRAVNYIHSLGLHIKPQCEDERDKYRKTLLSCIWAIDRMNAAIHGRPVLMHERDMMTDLDQCFEQQQPSFRLFLEVIVLLDKVIELYRPSSGCSAAALDANFPSFEDIVIRCEATQIGSSPLATIETLYHAVAILSSRSKSWEDPLRSSLSYLRQSISTASLVSSFGHELHDQLILFPFIPYAMALSLSIVYRDMRHSKIPMYRARARAQFQGICEVLSQLEGVFKTASTTANMGRKMLDEIDRALRSIAATDHKILQQEGASHNINTRNSYQNTLVKAPGKSSGETRRSAADLQIPVYQEQALDPCIFDEMEDIDLFGMFDPAFDLEGFEAGLAENVNPSYPTYYI